MSSWWTWANERVGIGDLVALHSASHPDAVGRIVSEADDGAIQCELVRGGKAEPGSYLTVTEQQLLLRIPR
jgi:hypothetical protein